MLVLDRISGFFHFLAQFYPPDLSRHYLSFLFAVNGDGPIVQSLSIALAGVFLAVLIALPLSIVIGTRMPGWRLLYSALAVVRSIPDLTLAVFCVILVGLGPGAGMITLVIYYAVAMAKVFGEIFLSADPRPLDALRSTGASRISLAAFGLIPLKLSDVLSYGIYELESAIRASVIVGAVGAGGIGAELVGSLNNFDYHRVTTLILALVLLIVLVDRFCWLVRRHPIALAVLPPAGIASLVYCWPQIFAMRHSIETFSKMLPPHLRPMQVHELPALILQTLGMAAGGTLCAALIALIAAPAASRGIAPAFLVQLTRRLQDFARAIPEVVWGLLLVTFVGVGPWAGGAALALHSSGVLGKLFAESLENVPPDPVRALEATGASRVAVAAFGNFPLAAGPIAVHTLFRFEWNVRAATVLGIIGAGGIGQALYESQQLFFYHEVLAYLLITCVIVGLFDFASTNLRKRYRVSWEAVEMTRPAVFITNRVHPEVIAFLEEFARVDANPNAEPLPRDLYLDRASRAEAIMVFMNDWLNAQMLGKCPNLRIVAAALKGTDNFDVAACTERGIWFTVVPDLLTIPTAELAIALALGLSRKVLEGDRIVRSGTFSGWRSTLYGAGLSGRTAGIVGMGNLGRALAKRLAAFDMKMLYVDPIVLPQQADASLIASRVDLAELLAGSDFVFLTLPLSSETLHLFGASTLAQMKPGSFLINVGRGSVVNEQAVAAALTAGTLAGYAADVFEMEDWARADRPTSICPALLEQVGKTLFTPHLGSAVAEIRLEIEMRAARNIVEALSGRRPHDAINELRRSR